MRLRPPMPMEPEQSRGAADPGGWRSAARSGVAALVGWLRPAAPSRRGRTVAPAPVAVSETRD